MSLDRETWIASARAVRIEDELARRGIKLNGKVERDGPCPKCGGNDRFSINIKKQLFNCRGCGVGGDVIDLVRHLDGVGFTEACTILAGEPPKANGKDHHFEAREVCTAEFSYQGEDGALLFTVRRIEYRNPDGSFVLKDGKRKKAFSQRRPDPNHPGAWINNVTGVPVVPYKLPELIEAVATDHFVVVVEGEAKVDFLASWNVPATCNAAGAGKWKPEHSEFLRGADVVILPDNDDPGRNHATSVGASLQGIAKSVRVLELPGLEPKQDIIDWAKHYGGTVEKLHELITCEATPWTPGNRRHQQSEKILLCYFSDLIKAKRKPWLIKNVIARGETSGWIAPPGKGKSALLADIFVHGSAGKNWRGYRTKVQFGGLYFALERVDLVKRRFVAHRLRDNLPTNLPIAIHGHVIDLMDRGCVDIILDAIKQAEDRLGIGMGLVGFDTYAKGIAAGGGDESDAKDQNVVLANLRRVLDKADVHIATVGHTGKDESRGERGSNAKLADHDLQVQISGNTIRSAIVKKANDQPEGSMTSFRLEPYDFGLDEDGDPFQTFIVSSEILSDAATDRQLSDRQQRAIEALAEVTLSHGINLPPTDGLPAGLKAVTADQWRDELYRRGILDKTAKNPRARFFELRNSLAAKHLIGVRDELVWLAHIAK